MPLIAFRARSSFVWKVVLAAALVVVGDWLFYRAELFGGYIGLYAAILLAALLAASHAVGGLPLAATGFALLALAESRLLTPTTVPGADGIFAGTALLYVPALLTIALSGWAPVWVRVVGALAAVPFLAHALIFFAGGTVSSSGPLAGAGYALLTVTIVGWIATLLRRRRAG